MEERRCSIMRFFSILRRPRWVVAEVVALAAVAVEMVGVVLGGGGGGSRYHSGRIGVR